MMYYVYMYTETDTRVLVPAAVCMILYYFVFKYNIIAGILYSLGVCVVEGERFKNYLFKRSFEHVKMHTAAGLTSIPMQLYRRRITSSL